MMKFMGLLLAVLLAGPVQAMQLPSLLEVSGDAREVTLPIKNDGDTFQRYVLSAKEISFPDAGFKVQNGKGEKLVFSPADLKLNPGQSGSFKVKYLGPKDDVERYFRLQIVEKVQQSRKPASAGVKMDFPLQVATNLVIRPHHPKLAYVAEGHQLRNTGNGYLLFMQDED
ncbi:MAG: fimbria/pilus periplasmic chaperone, partial [Iodobacter sp.]